MTRTEKKQKKKSSVTVNKQKKKSSDAVNKLKVVNMKKLVNFYSSFILFFFIPNVVCLIKTFEIVKNIFNSLIKTAYEYNKYDSLVFIAVVLLSVYSVVKDSLGTNESFIYVAIACLAFLYKVVTVMKII